jgi:hypothetical protein
MALLCYRRHRFPPEIICAAASALKIRNVDRETRWRRWLKAITCSLVPYDLNVCTL